MAFHEISTADTRSETKGSFSRQVVRLGGIIYGHWTGYALLKAGASYASVDIILPSYQRSLNNVVGLKLDALTAITSIGMKALGPITLGAATGKLKFASSLNNAVATNYVESAAAVSNVLAKPTTASRQLNSAANWAIFTEERTFKIYATDGAAAGAAAASTMTVTTDTRILVELNFMGHAHFPSNEDIPLGLDNTTDNNY